MNLLLDEIPLSIYDILRPYTDARFFSTKFFKDVNYFNLAREEALFDKEKPYYLSLHELDFAQIDLIETIQPSHIVLPSIEKINPEENLATIISFRDYLNKLGFKATLVLPWKGEIRHLKFLMTLSEEISLHWKDDRQLYIDEEANRWNYSKQFIYLGFRNLDELRRRPPKTLITSLPIKAAVMNIKLSERERRPKKIFQLDFLNYPIDSETLFAIKTNIEAIKEAANGDI